MKILKKQIVTVLFFFISFINEKYILNLWKITDIKSIILYIYAKIALIVFVYVLCYYVEKMIKEFKEIKEGGKVRSITFGVILGVNLISLILTWPGCWTPDTNNILHDVINMNPITISQGIITTLLYYVGIMIFPNISSILVIQIISVAIIVSTICTRLYSSKCRFLIVCVCFFECLPPVVAYNLLPMRASLFSHMIVLLFFMIYDSGKRNIEKYRIVCISILIAFISISRFEAMVFLVIIPGALYWIWKTKLNKLNKILLLFLPIVSFLLLKIFLMINTHNMLETSGRIIMITPLSLMLQEELKGDSINEDLEILNEYLDIEKIRKNPSAMDTMALYVDGGCFKHKEGYKISRGLLSYFRIVINNPVLFIKIRYETIKLLEKQAFAYIPPVVYTIEDLYSGMESEKIEELQLYKVYNPDIRNRFFISLYKIQIFWKILWVVVMMMVIMLIIRNKQLIIICISGLIYAIAIFCTVPNIWFMYYLPVYLMGGYIFIFFVDAIVFNREKT